MFWAVFGCVDLLPDDNNAVVTRRGDTAVVRCADPDQVRQLHKVRHNQVRHVQVRRDQGLLGLGEGLPGETGPGETGPGKTRTGKTRPSSGVLIQTRCSFSRALTDDGSAPNTQTAPQV